MEFFVTVSKTTEAEDDDSKRLLQFTCIAEAGEYRIKKVAYVEGFEESPYLGPSFASLDPALQEAFMAYLTDKFGVDDDFVNYIFGAPYAAAAAAAAAAARRVGWGVARPRTADRPRRPSRRLEGLQGEQGVHRLAREGERVHQVRPPRGRRGPCKTTTCTALPVSRAKLRRPPSETLRTDSEAPHLASTPSLPDQTAARMPLTHCEHDHHHDHDGDASRSPTTTTTTPSHQSNSTPP